MTRLVDPFRFHARAAITDWMRISRSHDDADPSWQTDWQQHWQRRKLESTVRYLGIEVDDALALSEQVEL